MLRRNTLTSCLAVYLVFYKQSYFDLFIFHQKNSHSFISFPSIGALVVSVVLALSLGVSQSLDTTNWTL